MFRLPPVTGREHSEYAAHRARDHQFFIRVNDANRDPAGGLEITPSLAALRASSSSMPRKPSPSQIRARTGGRVFADASGEDQRVQSAQRRGERADPFFDLIAEHRDRFRRSHVLVFLASKSRMSELVSETPSSPDWN